MRFMAAGAAMKLGIIQKHFSDTFSNIFFYFLEYVFQN
jgi:hypothetical protein